MFLYKVSLAARKAKENRSQRERFRKYLDDLKRRMNESQKSANSKLRVDGNNIKKKLRTHIYAAFMIEFFEHGFKCGYLLLPPFSRVCMSLRKCFHCVLCAYTNPDVCKQIEIY